VGCVWLCSLHQHSSLEAGPLKCLVTSGTQQAAGKPAEEGLLLLGAHHLAGAPGGLGVLAAHLWMGGKGGYVQVQVEGKEFRWTGTDGEGGARTVS